MIIPAHPCRGWDPKHVHLHAFPREILAQIVAIETHNGANKERSNRVVRELAHELGIPGVGGSDAHAFWQVGRCVTVFEREISTQEELVREGGFYGAYREEVAGSIP